MRIFVVTPIKQLYGRSIQSLYRAGKAWGQPLEYWQVQGDQPYGVGSPEATYRNVTHLYQLAAQRFLATSCDAMLTVESDMIIPEQAISRLTACLENGADIAYSLYVWRHGKHQWSSYVAGDGPDEGRSLIEADRAAAAAALTHGRVLPVQGLGLGCTLLTRAAVERVGFRRHTWACCDWSLGLDARDAGLNQVCDFGVVCGHITNTPVLRILWPVVPEAPDAPWWRDDIIDPRVLADEAQQ